MLYVILKMIIKQKQKLHYGYDNPNNRSEFYVKQAIKAGCMYVFSFYDLEEIKSISPEIKALTLEGIYNNLQDKGFIVYEFDYKIEK